MDQNGNAASPCSPPTQPFTSDTGTPRVCASLERNLKDSRFVPVLITKSALVYFLHTIAIASTGDISTEKGKPESNRYEFAGTGLQAFPIPFKLHDAKAILVLNIAKEIDLLAGQLTTLHPKSVVLQWQNMQDANLRNILETSGQKYELIKQRMIALQEELDWEVYKCFGLSDLGASVEILSNIEYGITSELRPFLWESDIPPDSLPTAFHDVYQQRRKILQSNPAIAIIEDLVFKRPWWGRQGVYGRLAQDYAGWIQDALMNWLLDRLETYFDFDGRMNNTGTHTNQIEISITSIAKLADIAKSDSQFITVGELYRNDPAFKIEKLITELVEAESVPHLPILRYKATGLRKRLEWEHTWELQRQEDNGTISPDTKIAVPPKYASTDFLKPNYWRLRGKLDVPKERWIAFPHCQSEDGTLAIAWAGYNHLQLAQTLSTYYLDIKERIGGSNDPRLAPLLASLVELIPWLKQWHNDIDPEFGLAMGDYYEGFLIEEAKAIGHTVESLKAWEPVGKVKSKK